MATRYYGTATAYSVAHAAFSQELELSTSAPGTGSSSEEVRKSSSEDTHLWTGPLAGTGVTAYLDDADQSLDLSAFPSGLALTAGVTAEDTSTSIVTDGGVSDVDSVTMGAWSSTTGTGIKTRTYSSGSFDAGTFATSDEVSWGISCTNSDNKNALTVTVDFSSNDTWVEITPDVSVTATGTPELQPLTMSGVGAMQQVASATGTLNLAAASIVGVGSLAPSDTTYTDLVQSLSPDGYWPLDDFSGNFRDASGNGYDATAGGSPSYRQTGPTINSEAQTAAAFTTSDLAYASEAIDDGHTEFTFSCWFNSTDATSGYIAGFVDTTGTPKTWELYWTGAGGIQCYAYADDGTTIHSQVTIASGEALADGAWHHLVYWRDSNGDFFTRIDGSVDDDDGGTQTGTYYGPSSESFTIAARTEGNAVSWDATMAHVAYWTSDIGASNREALYTGTASTPTATGSLSLSALTASGVGTQSLSATGATSLPAATIAGVGDQNHAATGALTGKPLTVTGAAAQSLAATGTITFESLAVVGDGDSTAPAAEATGSLTFGTASVTGTGEQANDATGAVALPAATVTGTAAQTNAATGAIDFEPVTVSGVADQTYSATGAITGQPVVIDGTGEALQPLEATGAVDLASISVVGAASVAHDATGAIVTGAVTVNGAAFQALGAAASGAILGAAVTVSGTAAQGYDASGTVDSEPVTVNATAAQTNAATGQSVIPATEVTGAAVQANVATGVIALAGVTMDGSAALAVSGAGDIDLAGVTVDGTGDAVVALTGTGTITLPVVDVDGVGATPVATVPGGRRRRQQQVEPTPPALVATGSVSLGAMRMTGTATSRDDDIWLYLDPALYLAGVR